MLRVANVRNVDSPGRGQFPVVRTRNYYCNLWPHHCLPGLAIPSIEGCIQFRLLSVTSSRQTEVADPSRGRMPALLKTTSRILRRIGLAEEPRVITDEDRRKILAMLESGMPDRTISATFGYSPTEIDEARRSNFLTGKLPPT